MEYIKILDLFLNNMKTIFSPEEWIDLDLSFSKTELFTMLLIDRHEEVIMSEIADHLNIPMSTATGMIDRLVKNGFLKRERSESDRRIVLIKLTDEGSAVNSKLKNIVLKYVELIYGSLEDEERQLLSKIFMKVIDIFNKRNAALTDEDSKDNKIKKIEID